MALRVPTPDVSVVDLVAELETETTEEAVNEAFRRASLGPLAGILDLCDEPLVSIDFTGNPHSSIVDGPTTKIIDGSLVKILAWYDNEWGYSQRVVDLAAYIGERLQ
jgi:glyceraldehyde 3-phosphate dehydrogenase